VHTRTKYVVLRSASLMIVSIALRYWESGKALEGVRWRSKVTGCRRSRSATSFFQRGAGECLAQG
jgi:hypothetical protein